MATKKKAKTTTKKTPAKKGAPKKLRIDLEPRLAALDSSAEENPDEPVNQLAALALRSVALAKPVLAQLKKLPGFDERWVTEATPCITPRCQGCCRTADLTCAV